MIALGTCFITSGLVGNNLGASKPRIAKVYANVSISLVLFLSLVVWSIIYTFKEEVAYVFTDEEDIQDLVVNIMPICLFLAMGDWGQCITSGVIRAMGYQKYGTAV
mmetsp:Transcript_23943/g.21275  ORF Transcript_23943/g.21275 Transcript_23943/m.21275 type:complete len:106 (+) Transcript_23943:342-659(+)